jgi:hypothetical protein
LGYKTFSCSPSSFKSINWPRCKKKDGGLFLLHEESLKMREINSFDYQIVKIFELGIFQIQDENEVTTCCIIYRPPSSSLVAFYDAFIK